MRTFYRPKGAALEYADLALNLYAGCENGCTYCYVPGVLRQTREQFHAAAVPRPGIVEAIAKAAPRYAGQNVFLCFSCDPYPEDHALTREVLQVLREAGLTWTVLTKQPTRALEDLDLYGSGCVFGTTITTVNEPQVHSLEPLAETARGRRSALQTAIRQGVRTMVSIEPVHHLNYALWVLSDCIYDGVAELRVGPLHHYSMAMLAGMARPILNKLMQADACTTDYILKRGFREALPEELRQYAFRRGGRYVTEDEWRRGA